MEQPRNKEMWEPTQTNKKMRILPTKSLPITRKYSSSVFKHILEEENILFSDDYRQFMTFVQLKAELQKSQTLISTKTKANHISTTKKDVVSKFYESSISAIEFQLLLIENHRISHEVSNLLSLIFQQENQTIHVYSSLFMSQCMIQADEVKTYHRHIWNDVDFLYISMNHDGHHWLLCQIDFSKKQILLLNSSTNRDINQHYLSSLKTYVNYVASSLQWTKTPKNKINISEKWNSNWTIKDDSDNSPQQRNADNSGTFTILRMCLLISGVKLSHESYSQTLIINHKTRERLAKMETNTQLSY
jgi:hypothetical protein